MDDGRCLLDVINDPDALTQFMTNDEGLSGTNPRFSDSTLAAISRGVQQQQGHQQHQVALVAAQQQQAGGVSGGVQYVVRQAMPQQFMAFQQQQQQQDQQQQPAVLVNGNTLTALRQQQPGAAQPQLIYLSPQRQPGVQQQQMVHIGQPGTVQGQPMRALVKLNQPGGAVFNIGQPGTGQQQVQLITSGGQLVAQAIPGAPGTTQQVQFINQAQQLQVQQQPQQQQQIQLRPAQAPGQPQQQQQQVQYVVQRALVNGVVQNIVLGAVPMQTMSAVPTAATDVQTAAVAQPAQQQVHTTLLQQQQQQQHVQVPNAGMPMRQMLVELKPNGTQPQQLQPAISGLHFQQMAPGQQQQVAMVAGGAGGGGQELQYRTLAVRTADQQQPGGGVLEQQQQQQQPVQQVSVMAANGEMRVITLTQDQLKQLIANNNGGQQQVQVQVQGAPVAAAAAGVWPAQAAQVQQQQQQQQGGATVLQNADGHFILTRPSQTVVGSVVGQTMQQQATTIVNNSHVSAGLNNGIAVEQQQLQLLPNSGNVQQQQQQQAQAGVADGQQQRTSAIAQAIALLNPQSRVMLAKIRARIKELMSQAVRTPEEDRTLQQLHDAQNKLLQSVKNIVQQRAALQQQQQQQQQQQLMAQQQLLAQQQQQQAESNAVLQQQQQQQLVRSGGGILQPVQPVLSALQQVKVIRPQERAVSPAPAGVLAATGVVAGTSGVKILAANTPAGAVRFPKILPALAPNAPSPSAPGVRSEVQQAPVVIALQQQQQQQQQVPVVGMVTNPPAAASLPLVASSTPLGNAAGQQQSIKLTPQVKEWLQAQLMKLPPDARQELLANPAPLLAKLQQLRLARDDAERNKTAANLVLVNGVQKDVKVESVARSTLARPLTRQQLFAHQLTRDQQGALNPDCKVAFKSWPDVIKRMVRYHVFNTATCNPDDVQQMEDQLERHATDLLERKENLMERYRHLLYADSIKSHPASESVMLERTFICSERELLKEERYIAQYAPDKFVPRPVLDKSQASLKTTLNLLALKNAQEANKALKRRLSDDDEYDNEVYGESVLVKRHRSESDDGSDIYDINEYSAVVDDIDADADVSYGGYQQQQDDDADAIDAGAAKYEYDAQSLPRTQSNCSLAGYEEDGGVDSSYCQIADDDQPMAGEFDGHGTYEQPTGMGEEEAASQQWYDSMAETDETQNAINSILGFELD